MDGDVGIWHETYAVSPGRETLYGAMPRFGPGARQEVPQRMKRVA
jgi:hypothetical protein